ncbi:MAG: class I SAM-dependent methyltransferase [Candidatus Heimdallarchaeota archaeon]
MTPHYFSEKPSTTGKTTTIQTHQLGNRLSFKSQSGIFGWMKVDTGSELLLNNLTIPKEADQTILDLGCGYGFLGIALAKAYPKNNFVLTDINELAARLARENCKTNKVLQNTQVYQGNLYEPIKNDLYDTIITNPPLMAGKKILKEIIDNSIKHLKKQGSIQLVVPKKKGLVSMQKMLEGVYGTYQVLAKGSGFWVLKSEKT